MGAVLSILVTLPLLPLTFAWGLVKKLPCFKYKHVSNLKKTVDGFVGDYNQTADINQDGSRRSKYQKTTETFYNLITDFYEYGWGESFHFAPRYASEEFDAAMKRYEHYVAAHLALPTPWYPDTVAGSPPPSDGLKVLDVGCGIGGPMRSIAQFFKYRVQITGLNITREHIERARRYNERSGVRNCELQVGDFNNMPFPDNHFDGVYDFEATLHSTDLLHTFREIYRVTKPGARVVTAQYCLLDAYDDTNPEHRDIIRRVDNTNGCYCSGRTTRKTYDVLQRAGFEVLAVEDVFSREANSDINFSEVFASTKGQRFTGTKFGLYFTLAVCFLGETLRLMPRGTVEVQKMLMGAAESFKQAGSKQLLTPGMLFVLRKPDTTVTSP